MARTGRPESKKTRLRKYKAVIARQKVVIGRLRALAQDLPDEGSESNAYNDQRLGELKAEIARQDVVIVRLRALVNVKQKARAIAEEKLATATVDADEHHRAN